MTAASTPSSMPKAISAPPEGVKSFKLPICRKIDEVILVNDYDALAHEGKEENSLAFT